MKNKRIINVNLIYVIAAILVVLFQFCRIFDLSNEFQAYVFSRAALPYLYLFLAIPILVCFFIYVPALFVVKIYFGVKIHTPILKLPYLKRIIAHARKYITKPKQSSLQVFRC